MGSIASFKEDLKLEEFMWSYYRPLGHTIPFPFTPFIGHFKCLLLDEIKLLKAEVSSSHVYVLLSISTSFWYMLDNGCVYPGWWTNELDPGVHCPIS